jgi:glycosyltransferase involved in cell wall biosynthesis
MSPQQLVSVIMIFLDEEQFMEEAIESVLAQTYDAWELLLVDDGSTDSSIEIALRYARQSPQKIFYLAHPGHENRGMSAARNLGIGHARGEMLAFLDADDVWLPDKLEQQLAILASQPEAAMVYGPTQWWYSWTGRPEDRQRDYVFDPGVPLDRLLQPPHLLTHFLRIEGDSPCTCSVLLRREVLEQVGGFEENFRGMYEDQAFFAKLCLKAPVFVSKYCSAKYRQHPNSNCSITEQSGQLAANRAVFLDWLKTYLSKQRIHDAGVWKALWRETLPFQYPALVRLVQWARHAWPGQMFKALRDFRLRWPSLPLLRQLRCLQLRRLQPLGNGRLRGTPIVRYYWGIFLQEHGGDIRGTALEIGTTATIRRYGGQAVTQANAIDLSAHSPEITVVADLSRADHLPSDAYDCFINQFTMHLIFDVEAALYHSIRILKPGGVLLVNFPSVDYYFSKGLDMGTGAPLFLYWWFTPIQVENLLQRIGLTEADYKLTIYGNLFARIAYQMNMHAEELTERELKYVDPGHPLLICARVVKPAGWHTSKPVYREPWHPDLTPAKWNPMTGHYAE